MKSCRQLLRVISVLMGTIVVYTGCTSDAAIQRLSLAEQSEFYTYRHVMTPAQERTYLAKRRQLSVRRISARSAWRSASRHLIRRTAILF